MHCKYNFLLSGNFQLLKNDYYIHMFLLSSVKGLTHSSSLARYSFLKCDPPAVFKEFYRFFFRKKSKISLNTTPPPPVFKEFYRFFFPKKLKISLNTTPPPYLMNFIEFFPGKNRKFP